MGLVAAANQKVGHCRPNRSAGRDCMDFIERIFGVAPDGGNGMLEFLLLAIPVAGSLLLITLRRHQTGRRDKR